MKIDIEVEKEEDYLLSERMIEEAFYNVYMPGAEEHWLLRQLRKDPSYLPSVSKIAWDNGRVVGGIFGFKSEIVTDKGKIPTISFGPLGVTPEYQKKGVGSMLVKGFIEDAKALGYGAIIILGVPTYYPRFGFIHSDSINLYMPDGAQFDALMGLPLKEGFFDSLGKVVCYEPRIMETRPSKEELDAFDKLFPPLKKEIRKGQWKAPNE